MARVVFMGTPDFAVPTLEQLIRHHEVVGVVTQPDRPAGRGRDVQMSPVKQVAVREGIAVFQPERIRHPNSADILRQWNAEIHIVAAFGQILPQHLLDLPPHGSINVHASLLPRWRGAAPIQAAIRAGDSETGITLMRMDAGLDTGPILCARAIPIAADDTGQTLHDKLAQLGADLLIEMLPGILDGSIQPRPQPTKGVTLAPRIGKDEGRIDWTRPAAVIERTIRAFTPWPSTFTTWQGDLLRILSGDVAIGTARPGQVIRCGSGIAIGTGDGLLVPRSLQLSGRKPASAEDFLRGHPAIVDSLLGQ